MTLFRCSARSVTLAGLLLLGTADARHNPRNDLEDIDQLPTVALVGGGVSLRILPLGDALTYGSPEAPNSYRGTLRELLVADGNPVDMVGSESAGDVPDNQVEAGPEWETIDELFERAKAAVPRFLPNVVLINAGAEDCRRGLETGDAGERILEMMRYSLAESVASSVVLSTALVGAGGEDEYEDEAVGACMEDVNRQIRELVVAQQALSRKVVLVDFGAEGGIGPEDLDEEGFPSAEAYGRMAKMWFDGIDDAGSRGWLEKPEPLPQEKPDSVDEPEPEPEPSASASASASASTSASGTAPTGALEPTPEVGDFGKPSAAGEASSDLEREASEGVASRVGGSGLALVVTAVVAMVMGV